MFSRHDNVFDGYADRLRNSRNRIERESMLLGVNPNTGLPVLLHTDLLFEHMHILGGSGSGKTALGLIPLLKQLIRRNDGAVVIVDCKGDSVLFNSVWLEAQRAGRTFKWFTNQPYRSTYIFNPFDEQILQRLTISEVIGLLMQSMNLHHGSEYGRAYFSIAARILLKRAIEETVPEKRQGHHHPRGKQMKLVPRFPAVTSFRELHEIIDYVTRDGKDFQAAQHVRFVIESLAAFEQLNLAQAYAPDHPALRHGIHMPDVVRNGQVVYFHLVGAMDVASVAELARLVLYSVLAATIAHKDRHGTTPRVYFVCDEAQNLIAQNIQVVLAQARSYGLACILSHQSMSQLNPPGGVDLRELVMSCTAVKQIFSARDPWLQRYISDMSGRVKYFTQAYDQLPEDVMAGFVGPEYAAPGRDGVRRISVREYYGPRLTTNDIQDISRHEQLSIVGVEHGKGLSQFHGWFPVHTAWPMSQQAYAFRRDQMPWPSASSATLEIESDWPRGSAETITATNQPATAVPDETSSVNDRLKRIKGFLDRS